MFGRNKTALFEQQPVQEGRTGHSGNLGLERPPQKGIFRKSDRYGSTPLHEAPVRPVPDTPEALAPWHKKKAVRIAEAVGGVVLVAGGIAIGTNQLSDGPDKPSITSTVDENEAPIANPEVGPNNSIIENVSRPSTAEHVQYILDNPVPVEQFSDPLDALVELGKHSNILLLANPDDYDAAQSDAMYASIYDPSSPYFQQSKDSMERRRVVAAAEFSLYGPDLQASLSLAPTSTTANQVPEGVSINTNIVYSGNILNMFGASPETAMDYNADMVLTNDGTNWHIYAANNNHEIGDIG